MLYLIGYNTTSYYSDENNVVATIKGISSKWCKVLDNVYICESNFELEEINNKLIGFFDKKINGEQVINEDKYIVIKLDVENVEKTMNGWIHGSCWEHLKEMINN